MRRFSLAAAALLIATGAAYADPIEGRWMTGDGTPLKISACGGSFCMTVASGEHAGKSVGSMKAKGKGTYTGSVTRLSTGKTYSGRGKLTGNSLKVTGCVMGVLCESQTWKRQ